MTDQNTSEQQATSTKQGSGDSKFNLMVTGLLVVIMVALAGLWLRERGQRVKFQQRNGELTTALDEAQRNAMLAGFGGGTPVGSDFVKKIEMAAAKSQLQDSPPQFTVVREELATIPMTVNGKNMRVLQLSAAVAKRAGFIPGDMIYVTEPPAAGTKE
ncbi:MAG: hypothetical protein KAR11_00880 [Phycisphaerae bacterium]|nr:hypothetical protein [Phycisphaerae bacterium]